jgi:hypothetical protein
MSDLKKKMFKFEISLMNIDFEILTFGCLNLIEIGLIFMI